MTPQTRLLNWIAAMEKMKEADEQYRRANDNVDRCQRQLEHAESQLQACEELADNKLVKVKDTLIRLTRDDKITKAEIIKPEVL